MVHYVECPNVLTTNIQKGQFCVMTVTDTNANVGYCLGYRNLFTKIFLISLIEAEEIIFPPWPYISGGIFPERQ